MAVKDLVKHDESHRNTMVGICLDCLIGIKDLVVRRDAEISELEDKDTELRRDLVDALNREAALKASEAGSPQRDAEREVLLKVASVSSALTWCLRCYPKRAMDLQLLLRELEDLRAQAIFIDWRSRALDAEARLDAIKKSGKF